jgi:CheY-like chemotaxis protein
LDGSPPLDGRPMRREFDAVGTTVLIVDDNPGFRLRARSWLEAGGFQVVATAADGRSALEATREHRPNVVLLDVGLPDVSGLAVARRLAAAPDPPRVVLTSTRDPEDLGSGIAGSGACGFLPKADLSGRALAALLASGAGTCPPEER